MFARGIIRSLAATRSIPAPAARVNMLLSAVRCFSGAGEKTSGTVKFFDSVKGYGFISPLDGSSDVFVHQSSILADGFRSLAEGEEVEFTIEMNDKNGKRFAANVTGPDGVAVRGAPKNDRFNDRGDRGGGGGRGGGGRGGGGRGGGGGGRDMY